MIASIELLMSSMESQGMQVGVVAGHALRSGTGPNPAVGVKLDFDESSSSDLFPPSFPFFPPL